jgi:hypothetical protein
MHAHRGPMSNMPHSQPQVPSCLKQSKCDWTYFDQAMCMLPSFPFLLYACPAAMVRSTASAIRIMTLAQTALGSALKHTRGHNFTVLPNKKTSM